VSDPAGVSIDGFCRPSSSSQAITAGCTGSDGAALTDSSTACGMCSGEFFLFMGGCYSQTETPGSEICTAAEGGRCTTCKTDSGLFKNPAASPTLGSECILCSDATNRDGVMGVAGCSQCTKADGIGAATCNTCQDGYYKDNSNMCQKCHTDCATCSGSASACASCSGSKYLKTDGTCADTCESKFYADPQSNKCIACSAQEGGITDCDTCTYDAALQGPKCTACNSGKKVKTALDGTTTCVDLDTECATGNTHFKDDGTSTCLQCGDVSKGVEHCETCTSANVCTRCLPGFFRASDTSCTACGANCATCTSAAINDCTACLPGYFLKTGSPNECVPCGDVDKGGIEGCAECTFSTSLTCISCKPNYRQSGSDSVTCTKACEDPTACGGTTGACGAIVVGGDGSMTYYCSQCRQQ
ncbi:Variant-specific surface protein, partial [Giardia duodenalis]